MIFDNEKKRKKILESIASSKGCSYYRVLPTGELSINNKFVSHVFLAYVRGNWFATYGLRTDASISIPEAGIPLFAYGNDSVWIPTEDDKVDIANSVLPLEENTHFVLFTFSGKGYDVIIADGSKYNAPISISMENTKETTRFLAMTLTSLIREYDAKAADEIFSFWFDKYYSPYPDEREFQQDYADEKENT